LLGNLLSLTEQFRANQSEVRELFFKTVRLTVNGFMAKALAEKEALEEGLEKDSVTLTFDKHLQSLRSLASAGPCNVRAAENVAISLGDALTKAAGERMVQLLQMQQSVAEQRYVLFFFTVVL
jgi:hypothetical protein